MNVDSFLKIGHSHTMCQDYVLASVEPFPYIILADGCSSANNSDIGARLLCHAALANLMQNVDRLDELGYYALGYTTIQDANFALEKFFPSLSVECLDATLIVAYKYKGIYRIFMYGDGCVFFISRDGNINYDVANYVPNAPYYLRYWIKGKEQYESNNIKMHYVSQRSNLIDNMFDADIPFQIDIPEEQIKTLIVASDGIESLMFKEEETYKTKYLNLYNTVKHFKMRPESINLTFDESTLIPVVKEINLLDVCKEITDFKLIKGPFLSRRVKKVLKEYAKGGFVNDDDISIGCFLED